MTAKIMTAEEVAEHYAPLLDLYGALLALEEARAENEWLREGLTYAWSLVEDAQYPDSVQMIRQMRFLSTYFDEDGLRLRPPRAALEKQP